MWVHKVIRAGSKIKLETKIENLQRIIADGNRTVKAVNRYKEELIKSQNKLSNLTRKFKEEIMFEKYKLKKRIKQLNKQIAAGDLQAMYDLAMIYLDGTVIKKDTNKAYSLLQQAADLGHLQSKTYLISKKISDSAVIGAKAFSDIQALFRK